MKLIDKKLHRISSFPFNGSMVIQREHYRLGLRQQLLNKDVYIEFQRVLETIDEEDLDG